jgi:hypothetical protein
VLDLYGDARGFAEQILNPEGEPVGPGQGIPQLTVADPASHGWSSSDPRVASVNGDTGVVTARHAGTATISVESGGITASVTLTVTG